MLAFDEKKNYKLWFIREGNELIFTATNVKVIGELITFKDKFNKQIIFPIALLSQAEEGTK